MSGPPPGWGMPGMVPGYPAAQPYGGMYGAPMYPPPGGAPMVMPGVLAPPTHKKDTKPDRREDNKVQPENIYTVYIGHIAEDVEPADIDQVLGYCGTTSGWNRIGADSNPKPLGFVTYEAAFPAARLLRVLDGLQLGSSKLVVKVDPATLARIQKAEPPPGELVLQEDEQIRERCKVVVARIEERKNAVEEAKNSALSSTFMESMTSGNGGPPVLYPPPAVPPLGPPSGPPPTGPPLTGPPTGPPPTGFPQVPPTAPPTGPPPTAPPKGPPPSKSSTGDIGKVRDEESKEERRKRQQDKDFRSALKKYELKERHRIRDLEDRKERKIKNSERDARFVEKEREFEANYDDNASNGDSKYYRSKQIFDLKENWRFEERWMTGDRERDAAETKKEQKEETVVEKPALVSGGSSIGFGLKAQAAAKAQTASVPVAQAPTASAVTNVFNADEDEESVQVKKRKLVKITYTDDQLRAAGLDPEKERKKRVEELIASIPVEKDPLFAYKVQWVAIDEALVDGRIKPWVDRKISEFVGGPEPSLVKFICDKIVAKTKPGAILAEVEGILDDEAEMFVKKLWRLLIYETEYKKLDLNSQQ